MRDEFEDNEPMGLMKSNEIYRKGYKAACVEIYKSLLEYGYFDEEARKFSGVEEEDIENLLT